MADPVVSLPAALLARYARVSLYDSPYRAHEAGRAVDLYPGNGRAAAAPSPVSGTVLETRTVRAPPKPYAPERDHLLLLECDGPAPLDGLTARVLHVDPTVAAGDRVDAGDSLGRLVRAGFFAPWVDDHLHVGFRPPDRNPYRASGSLPLDLGVDVRPLAWDGAGTVVATGETYAALDAPSHPAPGEAFVGVRADWADGAARGGERAGVIDGGLPHYDGGGLYAPDDRAPPGAAVSLNGDRLGAVGADGRTVDWHDVVVTASGDPITGLSAVCWRDGAGGAKLVCPDHDLAVGDDVRVRVRSGDDDGRTGVEDRRND